MAKIKMPGVPQISIEKLVNELATSYSNVINSGVPIKTFPSVMLWGAPGVGKSQAVRQIAKEIELQTGKKTVVTDVRLLLFSPIDLRGIPTANHDKTLAVWLKPQIFQMDASSKVVNVLFLDEISAAPQSVQASAYQITLDRVVGEHKLPENCIVIAAGNRVTDKSVAYKMPRALANRLMHFEVESSFSSWKKWAITSKINDKVLGFLSFKQNYLFDSEQNSEDLAFTTPRSWEMVSNVLNFACGDVEKARHLIAGLVGEGVAIEFRSWCKVYKDLPSIEDIFAGKENKVPTGTDALYALTSAMLSYAVEHKDELGKIQNSIVYADRLPPDFSVMLLKDYTAIEKDYKKKLLKIPEFSRWLSAKGRLISD